jgi:hypothetical protein
MRDVTPMDELRNYSSSSPPFFDLISTDSLPSLSAAANFWCVIIEE